MLSARGTNQYIDDDMCVNALYEYTNGLADQSRIVDQVRCWARMRALNPMQLLCDKSNICRYLCTRVVTPRASDDHTPKAHRIYKLTNDLIRLVKVGKIMVYMVFQ